MPNPFIIEAPFADPAYYDYSGREGRKIYQVGESFTFNILLFGHAIGWSQAFIEAASNIFQGEFGRTRDSVRLVNIWDGYNGDLLFDGKNQIKLPGYRIWSDEFADNIAEVNEATIYFSTPLQIRRNKMVVKDIDFKLFINSVFSRIAAIIDLYEDQEFTIPYGLLYRLPKVSMESNFEEIKIQQKGYPIVGLLGKIHLNGALTRYMPYIDLGGQLHIGGSTTKGCGEYQIEIGG